MVVRHRCMVDNIFVSSDKAPVDAPLRWRSAFPKSQLRIIGRSVDPHNIVANPPQRAAAICRRFLAVGLWRSYATPVSAAPTAAPAKLDRDGAIAG
jgi:hypothetical protein